LRPKRTGFENQRQKNDGEGRALQYPADNQRERKGNRPPPHWTGGGRANRRNEKTFKRRRNPDRKKAKEVAKKNAQSLIARQSM